MAPGESYGLSKKGDMASGSLANITENVGCGTLRSENAGLHEADTLSIAVAKNSDWEKNFSAVCQLSLPRMLSTLSILSAFSAFSVVAWSGTRLDKCILCTFANVLL